MRSEEDQPICCSCAHCYGLIYYGSKRWDVNCGCNADLGGVTAAYKKCPSYRRFDYESTKDW